MPESVFLTTEDKSLEGNGVVPDIWLRNSREEILSGQDRILETAIEYLKQN
ncbi:MAG TPA: hypothetical protein VGK25_01365 [Ignavibacteria bacterium]|jgi:C-terminal processing protease CtpA/Prc